MFFYDYCEIFKNSFLYRTPLVAAFKDLDYYVNINVIM